MATVDLVCDFCRNPFKKARNEYARRVRKGSSKFYCTSSCQTREKNRTHPCTTLHPTMRADNQRDDYTPFRWFVARARNRTRKGQHDLTVEYLKQVWERQGGRCELTGLTMSLPRSTAGFNERHPQNASLDRIDNSLGYMQGNVRFLCFMANIARSNFKDEDVKDFCRAVAEKV